MSAPVRLDDAEAYEAVRAAMRAVPVYASGDQVGAFVQALNDQGVVLDREQIPAPSQTPSSGRPESGALLVDRSELATICDLIERDMRWDAIARIELLADAQPAPAADVQPPEAGRATMHIIRRADGEEMGEFSFFATDGPEGWDAAENADHDEDTVYEILACRPVTRRKFLSSTLCQTCDGEGDGCPACAGTGEHEQPDTEYLTAPVPSGDGRLDVTKLPEWRLLTEASDASELAYDLMDAGKVAGLHRVVSVAAANFIAAVAAAPSPAEPDGEALTTNGIVSDCGGPLTLTSCPVLVDLAAWVDAGEDPTDPIHAHLWEPNDGPGHPGCGPCQFAVLRFRDNPKATR